MPPLTTVTTKKAVKKVATKTAVKTKGVITNTNIPKCIGIVGSRRRNSPDDLQLLIESFNSVYKRGDSIVSGGCKRGADAWAEEIAEQRGISITIHYPRRENYDHKLSETNIRAAHAKINYARNTSIAEQCDVLIALVHEDRDGGTEDTVSKALKLGKEVVYA